MQSPQYKLLNFDQIDQWDRIVESHHRGSILQTTAMIRAQLASRHHFPYAIGAVNADGRLLAILNATRIVTMSGLGSQIASRSIMYAEPLYEDSQVGLQAAEQLVAAHDRYMSKRTLFAEVRPIFGRGPQMDPLLLGGYEKLGYVNYELPLCPCEDTLFRQLGQKRRNNVRSAARKGVLVSHATGPAAIPEMYSLLCASYSRSKLPIVDQSLFCSVAEQLDASRFRIYTANFEGRPVATCCFLTFKDRVICWYAGTLRIPGVAAMSSVFWHSMRTYAAEGYKIFDFAGGGWEGQEYGPGKFKSKFGGIETHHGRYRKVYAPWKLRVASAVYDRVRDLIAPKSKTVSSGT
ncbi:MAG TPA: hypothetical protein DCF63_12810 [Planctomycetaceae bacterium]|nr:hypothetical protein [Planctomycetaceae bacterium]